MVFPWERDLKKGNIAKTVFPDNSIKIGLRGISDSYTFVMKDHESIWEILLLNNILVRLEKKADLKIKYLMYQQDDRIFDRKESFGLQVLADVLNSLEGFNKISVFDPHSDVVNLIRNVEVINAEEFIKKALRYLPSSDTCVLTPDAGAYKKYAPQIPKEIPVYSCSKIRNSDGSVKSIVPNEIIESNILIVDDIGLGCNTHIKIAEKLKDKNVSLYVSHGVFNQGVNHLKPYFVNIFTTDSICKLKEEVTIIK